MKTYIYKITCETGLIYYGSSKDPYKRFRDHYNKKDCACKGFINPSLNIVEEFEVETKREQLEKEKYYIQNFECVNTKYPLFDKTKHLEDRKNLREKNKEKINAERREKIECHICNKMISKYNMKRHLESSAHSKTIMTPEERKIKRNEKALEKIECSHCNKLFCRSSLKRHILRKHGI